MKLKTLKNLEFESTLEFPSIRYIDEFKGQTTDGKNSEEIHPDEDHLVDAKELKQEAIKWVKWLTQPWEKLLESHKKTRISVTHPTKEELTEEMIKDLEEADKKYIINKQVKEFFPQADWIKHFFNISKEEINGEDSDTV